MFNQYIWELYLKSGGRDVVEKFEYNLTHSFTQDYADFIRKLRQNYTIDKWITDYDYKQLIQQYEDYKEITFPDNTLTFSDEKDIDGFFLSYLLGDDNKDIEDSELNDLFRFL